MKEKRFSIALLNSSDGKLVSSRAKFPKFDTVTECIYHVKTNNLLNYIILDEELKVPCTVNLDTHFTKPKKRVPRIAGQELIEGNEIIIPSNLKVYNGYHSRSVDYKTEIILWTQSKLEENINIKVKDPSSYTFGAKRTYMNKFKIIKVDTEYVSLEGLQVSNTSLRASISKENNLLYIPDLVPFNLKVSRVRLGINSNKMLFI